MTKDSDLSLNKKENNGIGLKKTLGVPGCVSFLLQLIIGSGIFIMPNVNISILLHS